MIVVYTDGGVYPYRGVYWSVLVEADGAVLHHAKRSWSDEYSTNNEAEYLGMLAGLRAVKKCPPDECVVRSDSQLVIRQISGRYRVKEPRLKPFHEQVHELVRELKRSGFNVSFEWVPREKIVPILGH